MDKGFFPALFDFDFKSFITPKIVKVVYVIAVVAAVVYGLFILAASGRQGGAGFIVGLVLGPVVALVGVILARIYLEVVLIFFAIQDNTARMAERLGAPPAGASPDEG
jgi:hypothetical protein